MKYFTWNNDKNWRFRAELNVSFEEVVFHIDKGQLLDILEHPNQVKYRGQRLLIVNINDHTFLVPSVETERHVRLRAIIPSRKAVNRYMRGDNYEYDQFEQPIRS